jgi:hypothetical protein
MKSVLFVENTLILAGIEQILALSLGDGNFDVASFFEDAVNKVLTKNYDWAIVNPNAEQGRKNDYLGLMKEIRDINNGKTKVLFADDGDKKLQPWLNTHYDDRCVVPYNFDSLITQIQR